MPGYGYSHGYGGGAGRRAARWPLYFLILLPIIALYVLTISETIPFGRQQFMAYLLGCVSLGFSFINLQAGLVLIVLSIGLSPEFDVATVRDIRFEDMMIPSVFIIWLLQHMGSREKLVPTSLRLPIIIYLLIAAVSSLHNAGFGILNGKTSFFIYLKYVEYFLLLILTANLVRTERQIAVILIAAIIGSLFSAFIGMYQRAAGHDFGNRVTGPEGETANIYGGYLIFHLLLAFGLFVTCPKPALKACLAGYMLILFYVVLRTLSRGAYIGLASALVVMGLLLDKRILLWVLLFLVAAPLLFPEDVANRLGTIVNVLPGSNTEAPTSWQSKVSAWRELKYQIYVHPLFGRGVGAYPFGWVDNEYVKVVIEVGFTGLCVWVWWIGRMALLGWQNHLKAKVWWHQGASIGYVCGLCGLLVHAIAATSFSTIRTMEAVMVSTGLMVSLAHILERRGRLLDRGADETGLPEPVPTREPGRLVKLRRGAGIPPP